MELILSFLLNLIITFLVIKFTSKVQNPVRDFVPKTEGEKLKISPFGGIPVFFSSILMAFFFLEKLASLVILIPTFLMLILGVLDDFQKIFSQNYKGISAKFKLVAQSLTTLLTCFICYFYNSNFETINFILPFYGMFDFKIFLFLSFVISYFTFTGTVNAMNLTDGLDGLAGKQALLLLAFLFAILCAVKFDGLNFEITDLKTIILCFIGSSLAFLVFNTNPAKIFMGDSGSMMFGALIATIFILLKLEFMLIFVGFVIFMEAFSVILQVVYFKLTKGKRIFKMSPIHHHFQLSGMKEQKVTEIAFLITLLICIFFLTSFF
jgi:phospho-N-acetylmuramoyl-pentapeptide-transferase